MRDTWGVWPSQVARCSWGESRGQSQSARGCGSGQGETDKQNGDGGHTKREFLRQETTSGGRVVAMCGWVVVAEGSYVSGGLWPSAMMLCDRLGLMEQSETLGG